MYCGLHGVTIIEIPDGRTIYSRDIYFDVNLQKVIEIVGEGKFLIHHSRSIFQKDISSPGMPALEAPYYLHRLKVRPGDFQNVETDAQYLSGADLRPEVAQPLPPLHVTLEPPDYVQLPLREAEELYKEETSAHASRLSSSVRDRLIGATVYIQCMFEAAGIQVLGATGTGFLISPHGFIVTNNHVIAPEIPPKIQCKLKHINVTLGSGTNREKTYQAKVVRVGEVGFDLALLKISETGLDFLCIENGVVTELEPVVAVGFPGGQALVFSGTNPNVSFRSGQITSIRKAPVQGNVYYEHSAPIEQGNSGGPLVTLRGTVVGVNTFLHGPQKQSRFAISKDTVKGFFFKETAEGKGPYLGSTIEERYSILIARIATIWNILDGLYLFKLQTPVVDAMFYGWKEHFTQEQAKQIALYAVETLQYILQTLDAASPPTQHRRSHAKIRGGFTIQKESVEKMLGLIAGEEDDKYVGPAKMQIDNRSNLDKFSELSDFSNAIQSGRTQLCFAINRVVGQLYSSVEQVTNPSPPLSATATLVEYSLEAECALINETANIFQRHRGNRVFTIRFPVKEWEREVVYKDSLVSGSEAMMREFTNLIKSKKWI